MALLLLSLFSHAQKPYSVENLEKASQEELDVYLNKALQLKKSGKTVTIIGGSILGATAVTALAFGNQMDLGVVVLGFFGGLAGIGTMGVGIPMNITGKKRIERINEIRNTAFYDGTRFEIKPSIHYNHSIQDNVPGVTLAFSF